MLYSVKISKKQRFFWVKTKQNQQCQIKEKQSNFLLINLDQKVFAKVFWSENFFSIFCFFFFPARLSNTKEKIFMPEKNWKFSCTLVHLGLNVPPFSSHQKNFKQKWVFENFTKIYPAYSKTLSKYHSVNRGRSISWDKDLFAYGRDQTLCLN